MKIFVTGHTGFIGQHLVPELQKHHEVLIPDTFYDLVDSYDLLEKFLLDTRPDTIVHLAGFNGGIMFNKTRKFEIFYKNTMMALNLFKLAREVKIPNLISFVTGCSYPAETYNGMLVPTNYWNGLPEDNVQCHAFAKRNLQALSMITDEINAVTVCPTHVYGPGDQLDPMRSKVLGSMMVKFIKAVRNNDEHVILWGDGSPTRDFIYVKDLCHIFTNELQIILQHSRHYPLNIGFQQPVSIKMLAEKIKNVTGFKGSIAWDTSKPNGAKDKTLKTQYYVRDKSMLVPSNNLELPNRVYTMTSLDNGLLETYKYYLENVQ